MATMPSEILAQFFIDRGIAVDPTVVDDLEDWPIVWGPPSPDNDRSIALVNYGADLQGRNYPTAERTQKPRVQIRIRSVGDDIGYYKGMEIEDLLNQTGISPEHGGIGNPVVTVNNGTTIEVFAIYSLKLITPTSFVSREEDNPLRANHTINVRMSYRKESSAAVTTTTTTTTTTP